MDSEKNIRDLELSSDGFSTVAKFFGQGLIRLSSVESNPPMP